MKKVLVAYATKARSTAEVAEVVGETLRGAGLTVDVRAVNEVKKLRGYDGLVIGSAVRMGKLLSETLKFARKHRETLAELPVAYFTSGLTMSEDTPQNRETAMSFLGPLRELKEPLSIGLFGGVMDYEKLESVLRWMFSKDESGEMSEGDWRDWDAIRTWARNLPETLFNGLLSE